MNQDGFDKSKILVGIPAYNSAKSIDVIINNAKKYSSRIVVCDDGSVDDTYKVAQKAGAIVIKHEKNKGYGAAIKSLFNFAREENPEVFVTIDSDGQHNVDDIPRIVQPIINSEIDIVTGSRFLNKKGLKQIPRYRSIGIKALTKITKYMSYDQLSDSQCGFRAYGKKAISKLEVFEDGMAVSAELLLSAHKQHLTITEVPIVVRYDMGDTSTHNPIRHGISVLSSIYRFASVKHPLSFYTLPGLCMLAISIFFMGWALDLFSETRYVSTNMIVVSAGTGIIGIVLAATGVILYNMTILIRGNSKN